jgi:hypothetical protein
MSYFKTEYPFVPEEFTRADLILTTILFGFLVRVLDHSTHLLPLTEACSLGLVTLWYTMLY